MNRVQLSWANLASYDDKAIEMRRAGRVACERLGCDQGKVLDLSRSGARIRIRAWREPRVGQERTLVFKTCDGSEIPFACRVAWRRRVVWGLYEVGVEFCGLSEADQAKLVSVALVHADRSWIHGARDPAA